MGKHCKDGSGKAIEIGDKVQTPSGAIIEVTGIFEVAQRTYSASELKLVPKGTKRSDGVTALAAETGDAIVWGS